VEAYDDEGLVPDPFVITDREHHARLKRGAAAAYSLNTMVQLEPYVDVVSRRLVQKLKGVAATGEALDFAPLLQAYAMDAVSALTFGKDFNHMDAGDHLGFLRASAVINSYLAIVWFAPFHSLHGLTIWCRSAKSHGATSFCLETRGLHDSSTARKETPS
jgi:cytochrome P450